MLTSLPDGAVVAGLKCLSHLFVTGNKNSWSELLRLYGVLLGFVVDCCPKVNVILKELPIAEFGPAVGFREYSFLDNPSLPKQVKESWLDVQLFQAGTNGCNASSDLSRLGLLRFPRRSNEETFKTVFYSFKYVKVIQFVKMQDAFLGFSDKKREENFRKRVKRYVGVWSCVDNHNPGHIYYDMYWDETPNWKPLPPQTPKDDHPHW